jgi:hypothetical protein
VNSREKLRAGGFVKPELRLYETFSLQARALGPPMQQVANDKFGS